MKSLAQQVWVAALASLGVFAHAASTPCGGAHRMSAEGLGKQVVLVGETHGSEQAPQFVAELVCSLLVQERSVVLALERDDVEQTATDRFLDSDGMPRDIASLLSQPGWRGAMQDGRSSQAMLDLLDRMRKWRKAGHSIDVLMLRRPAHVDPAMSGARVDARTLQAKEDLDMADAVTQVLVQHPGKVVIVLAGTFHTAVGSELHREMMGAPSMGDVLARRTPVHVIGLRGGVGEVWACTRKDGCGPLPISAGDWDLSDARVDERIDLGPITASSPAVRPPPAPASL